MTIDDMIAALKQRRLEIDCVEMTLTQNSASNPIQYRGKGYIKQTEKDELAFKLYASEALNTNAAIYLNSFFKLKSGEIFPENAFYSLTALSADGTQWTADKITPECGWPKNSPPIVTGAISLIATDRPALAERHKLRLHFFDEILGAADTMTVTTDYGEVLVWKNAGEFTVAVSSSAQFVEHFHTRIEEAFRFILARSVAWRAMVRIDGGRQRVELCSAVGRSLGTRLNQPLSTVHLNLDDHWRIFSRYLDYIIKNTPHAGWNQCSYHLHNACEASANSIEAFAIGLSVAVEGISSLLDAQLNQNKNDDADTQLDNLRAFILEQLKSNEKLKRFCKRIEGLLQNLKRPRPQDNLWPLVKRNCVVEEHLKAWQELRNTHVHPKAVNLEEIANRDFQRLYDLILKTTVLMYHIIFHLIGYSGKYSDYSSRDYPIRDYPPSEKVGASANCGGDT